MSIICPLSSLNDGCSSTWRTERCGVAIKQTNESCDDGNANNGDTCDNYCRIPVCGDGIIQGTEKCDDAVDNDLDGLTDSHDSDCKAAFVTSSTVTGNILVTVTSNQATYGSCGVNLTGTQAADCICNVLAANSTNAFINDSERAKTYVAFISNNLTGTNAIDRLTHNGQYLNANKVIIADRTLSGANLWIAWLIFLSIASLLSTRKMSNIPRHRASVGRWLGYLLKVRSLLNTHPCFSYSGKSLSNITMISPLRSISNCFGTSLPSVAFCTGDWEVPRESTKVARSSAFLMLLFAFFLGFPSIPINNGAARAKQHTKICFLIEIITGRSNFNDSPRFL